MCKKITLINPPGYKPIQGIGLNSPNPPIGLAYLAGSLEKNGIDYDLIDMTGEAFNQVTKLKGKENIWVLGLTNLQVIDRISMDTDIIGISCIIVCCCVKLFCLFCDFICSSITKDSYASIFVYVL